MGESESKFFETLKTDLKNLLYTVLCFKVPTCPDNCCNRKKKNMESSWLYRALMISNSLISPTNAQKNYIRFLNY
jgi:hypothetical protein